MRAKTVGDRHDREIGELLTPELVTDLHAHRVGIHGVSNDLIEGLLLLDDAQDRTQFAQILELRLIEQVLRSGRGDGRLFARPRGERRGFNCGAKIVGYARLLCRVRDFAVGNLAQQPIGESRVQRVRETREIVGIAPPRPARRGFARRRRAT